MSESNPGTPFLEIRSFAGEHPEVFASEVPTPAVGSPFLSLYELEGDTEFVDPAHEAYSTLVQDLYDEEFDEALFELLVAARGVHEEHMLASPAGVDSERLLSQHFETLVREAENTVAAFAQEFGSRDLSTLRESELEEFAERYSPATALSPEFEDFLGKWKKKLVGLAKKAGKFALKAGLGPVLARIKPLLRPMVNKVLQMAIGKLPSQLRPAAEQLADRLLKRVRKPVASTDAASAPASDAAATQDGAAQAAATPDVSEIQHELDQQLANLFVASDEIDMELEVARVRSEDRAPATPVYAELDQARERFIDELEELRDGEDPAPVIQNFLPAVLPALKLGIKLIGRPKVIGFLASLLAKLIGKLIGPAAAPALSRAIVDTGLSMLSLEVSPQDEKRAAAASVAATAEEAVRRVSALPDYVLDNQELLEGFAVEAFEQAAAANLPPILSEAVYNERPELLESRGARTCWVMLPLRRPKRYKKCGRTFTVRITPAMADEIESFEGPLSDYLHDQLAVEEGAEVEAEVSLYETLPGTTLPDIAREEGITAKATNAAQLHPLTPKAAGLLLGEPRMGRIPPPGTGRLNVGVGQRVYRLSIPGRRPLAAGGAPGRPELRRTGGLRLTLDCPADEVRMRIFLSEVKAQRMAVRVRREAHAGSVAAGFSKYIARRLPPLLRGERPARIRILQAGLAPGAALATALAQLPADITAALVAKLQEAAVTAFAEFVKSHSQSLVAASEAPEDGITLKFTIGGLRGLQQLGKALLPGGRASGVAESIARSGKPQVRVEVSAGYTR